MKAMAVLYLSFLKLQSPVPHVCCINFLAKTLVILSLPGDVQSRFFHIDFQMLSFFRFIFSMWLTPICSLMVLVTVLIQSASNLTSFISSQIGLQNFSTSSLVISPCFAFLGLVLYNGLSLSQYSLKISRTLS